MKRIGFIDGRRIAGWSFPATAVPGNGQVVDVTDPSAGAVGSVFAQRIIFRPTGNKTGVNYLAAHRIDVVPHGDTFTLRGQVIDFATPGRDSLIHQYFAQDINLDPLGPAVNVGELAGISIGIDYTVPTTLPHSAFLRLYAHGAVPIPAAIRIAGSGVTNLFYFQRSVTPIAVGAVGGTQTRKIRVHIADVPADYFIPLHSA